MIRRISIGLCLLLYVLKIQSAEQIMVWITFVDKNNTSYSLNRPHEFLSQRAIERRQHQMIPLDANDLPVSTSYLETLLSNPSIELYYTSRWFNGALVGLTEEGLLEEINTYEFVQETELVKPSLEKDIKTKQKTGHSLMLDSRSQDTVLSHSVKMVAPFPYSISSYWNTHPNYGLAQNQVELVNGQILHKLGYRGNGKVIAVLDSGFSNVDSLEAFQHLWHKGKILGTKDFVNPGTSVFREHFHGTYVLSVMAGFIYDEFAGAALDASYLLLRTEDASSEFRIEEYNWLAGAEYADSAGADIINSSLGYTVFDYEPQNYTYAHMDGNSTIVARAANKANSRGLLVVNSAGNYGNQNWRYVGSPADAHGVLAVGGTDDSGVRVGFSSVGPTSDGRIKPDVMAKARAVASVNPSGGISNANGTSFSAPLISALAACLWQRFPDASNDKIKNAIIQSGDRFLSPDSLYGNGIPDFQKAYDILNVADRRDSFVSLGINPVKAESSLIFHAEKEQRISIELINSSGQRIWYLTDIPVQIGYNELKPFRQIEDLTSGVYLIKMNFKNHTELIKALKL